MTELTRLCGLWRRTGQRGRVTYWAGRLAEAEDPALFGKLRGRQLPRRQRRAIEDLTGTPVEELIERARPRQPESAPALPK